MKGQFTNEKSVTIHSQLNEVWQALTDPSLIREYFFGVETHGDWKEGNTIVYKGEWQGRRFSSKAKVLVVKENETLKYSYWSDMSGQEDSPENYHIITYKLHDEIGSTRLVVTEENLQSAEMKERSSLLWDKVLEMMKQLLEKVNAN